MVFLLSSRPTNRLTLLHVGVVVTLMASLSSTASAQAGKDEIFVTGGPTLNAAPDFRADNKGPGLELGGFWGLHDFISVGAQAGYAAHGSHGSLVTLFAGAAFTVDVTRVIPFIVLGPVVYFGDRDLLGADATPVGVRAAIGFDVRPRRNWAIGADIAWHAVAVDGLAFPGYSVVRLRLSGVIDLRRI